MLGEVARKEAADALEMAEGAAMARYGEEDLRVALHKVIVMQL